jgi:hypothetical protein
MFFYWLPNPSDEELAYLKQQAIIGDLDAQIEVIESPDISNEEKRNIFDQVSVATFNLYQLDRAIKGVEDLKTWIASRFNIIRFYHRKPVALFLHESEDYLSWHGHDADPRTATVVKADFEVNVGISDIEKNIPEFDSFREKRLIMPVNTIKVEVTLPTVHGLLYDFVYDEESVLVRWKPELKKYVPSYACCWHQYRIPENHPIKEIGEKSEEIFKIDLMLELLQQPMP